MHLQGGGGGGGGLGWAPAPFLRVCQGVWTIFYIANDSLVPSEEGEEKERLVYTVCACA